MLINRLRDTFAEHPHVSEVRGLGLMIGLELVADRASREPLAPWPQMPLALKRLLKDAMAQGVSFAARGNLILLAPPLVIGEQ